MNLIILGGFLGSGKTSVLLSLARYIIDKSGMNNAGAGEAVKVAVIENEIGDISVDDMALSASGFHVTGIFGGCICCSLSGELPGAIHRLKDKYHPEWIMIETTGLAYPEKVKRSLESCKVWDNTTIITVVDASRWLELQEMLPPLASGQVDRAEILLLNKMDLATPEEAEKIKKELRFINPGAVVQEICAARGIPGDVWRRMMAEVNSG